MGRALGLVCSLFVCAACGRSSAPATVAPNPTPEASVPDGPGQVVEARFRSAALGVEKRAIVYLPAGYQEHPERRYPVVYMLHGLGGDETNWTDRGKLAEAADAMKLQAIVVMPDGDVSFYANWVHQTSLAECEAELAEADGAFCTERQDYETYMTRDLIEWVDRTYRTIPERAARGIGGLSMGGFGALMLSLRHPDLYASAASHSGVDSILYAGPYPYEKGAVQVATEVDLAAWGQLGPLMRRIFGEEIANWQAHDPPTLVGKLGAERPALYLDCGTEDEFRLHFHAQYLHDVLLDAGIDHAWYLGPGEHDMAFWSERIDDSLAFHVEHLAKAR